MNKKLTKWYDFDEITMKTPSEILSRINNYVEVAIDIIIHNSGKKRDCAYKNATDRIWLLYGFGIMNIGECKEYIRTITTYYEVAEEMEDDV